MSNQITQVHGTTAEQFKNSILNGVKLQIENLKKDFQPKTPTEYLTRKEVKELLKVDLSTVHNWTVKGKLIPYGIGNRIYYKRSQVEQAIKPLK